MQEHPVICPPDLHISNWRKTIRWETLYSLTNHCHLIWLGCQNWSVCLSTWCQVLTIFQKVFCVQIHRLLTTQWRRCSEIWMVTSLSATVWSDIDLYPVVEWDLPPAPPEHGCRLRIVRVGLSNTCTLKIPVPVLFEHVRHTIIV